MNFPIVFKRLFQVKNWNSEFEKNKQMCLYSIKVNLSNIFGFFYPKTKTWPKYLKNFTGNFWTYIRFREQVPDSLKKKRIIFYLLWINSMSVSSFSMEKSISTAYLQSLLYLRIFNKNGIWIIYWWIIRNISKN